MPKQYILIGASAASFGALHALTKFDPHARIILISAEAEFPYNKCKLADYLAGMIDQKDLKLTSYENYNISFVLGQKVIDIDVTNKTIKTDKGQSFFYDFLFLGMGSSPIFPKIHGITTQGIFTFHTNKDADTILKYIKQNAVKKILVIGAGLSGLEAADALIKQNLSVTIVERNNQILPSLLCFKSAEFLQAKIVELNAKVILNSCVQEILSHRQKVSAAIIDNLKIDVDMVIVATGLQPNISLCTRAGLLIDEYGLVVNDYLQTNIPTIYAGGDLIGTYDQLTSNKVRSCLWPDAMQQGMHAGMAMAGKPKPYAGISMITSTAFFGLKYARAGILQQANQLIKTGDDFHHTFAFEQNILKGFQVLGNAHNLGVLRRLILTQQSVLPDQFDSPYFN